MTEPQDTIEKVLTSLKKEMELWFFGKKTGQLLFELNYSCGGLSKVYITEKRSLK
jgi:hypothetical protein